jgi:hypothetical protein
MSVLISEPRSRARLKKPLAKFNVGIKNRAQIKRKRALKAVNRISGIQRDQEITAREKRKMFCKLVRR